MVRPKGVEPSPPESESGILSDGLRAHISDCHSIIAQALRKSKSKFKKIPPKQKFSKPVRFICKSCIIESEERV